VRTFVWAIPHQYQADAPLGTSILLDLGTRDRWTLARAGDGWDLDTHRTDAAHDAELHASPDGGWRWLSGATVSSDDLRLTEPTSLFGPAVETWLTDE
jgi:hypothetical protein